MADETKKPDVAASFAEAGVEHVGVLLEHGKVLEGHINQSDNAIISNVMARMLSEFRDALDSNEGQSAAPKGPSLHPRP